jgi:hypothetical protein
MVGNVGQTTRVAVTGSRNAFLRTPTIQFLDRPEHLKPIQSSRLRITATVWEVQWCAWRTEQPSPEGEGFRPSPDGDIKKFRSSGISVGASRRARTRPSFLPLCESTPKLPPPLRGRLRWGAATLPPGTENRLCDRLGIRQDLVVPESQDAIALHLQPAGTLDKIIPVSEAHLRATLRQWVTHYNGGRPHKSFGPGLPGPPVAASVVPKSEFRHRLPAGATVYTKPILCGLHHEYSLVPGGI